MKLKKEKTNREFTYTTFKDSYGNKCSLQMSSSIEPSIWLGCDEIGLKKLDNKGGGWEDIDTSGDETTTYIANTRMHLTREQVKALLPLLTKFAASGDLF